MITATNRKGSVSVRLLVIATLWLVFISSLHVYFNSERGAAQTIRMGYMPVITNLAAPLVDAASRGADPHFEALKFGSFAEMAEAFRAGHIQVAFIIAPLAIMMHQQGIPLKVVYIGNRHESTLVIKKDLPCRSIEDLEGKTVAVPLRFSGHMLALKRYLREKGVAPDSINIVEIPPPDMAVALKSGGIDGYFVGEPFASITLITGDSQRLLDVETIWPEFICNLMIVREDLIRSHEEWVQKLVSAAARSGLWAQDHMDEAVQRACSYWGQDPKVVWYAFSNPPGRVQFDLFTPLLKEMEELAREMHLAGLTAQQVDVHGLVEDRFAKKVEIEPLGSFDRILDRGR